MLGAGRGYILACQALATELFAPLAAPPRGGGGGVLAQMLIRISVFGSHQPAANILSERPLPVPPADHVRAVRGGADPVERDRRQGIAQCAPHPPPHDRAGHLQGPHPAQPGARLQKALNFPPALLLCHAFVRRAVFVGTAPHRLCITTAWLYLGVGSATSAVCRPGCCCAKDIRPLLRHHPAVTAALKALHTP